MEDEKNPRTIVDKRYLDAVEAILVKSKDKISDRQLSRELGKHVTFINKLKSGGQSAGIKHIEKISTLYNVSTEWIINGEKPIFKESKKPEFESLSNITKEVTKQHGTIEPKPEGTDFNVGDGSFQYEDKDKEIARLNAENNALKNKIQGMLELAQSLGVGNQIKISKQRQKVPH